MYFHTRVMKTLKLEGMSPLVYQLLLLASRGHQSLILTGIRSLFDQLDQDNMKENSEENQVRNYTMDTLLYVHIL